MRSQTGIRETESELGIHELSFSRADPKGLIQSGNEVFARVSGHPRAEMLGKAHNMIRHPDMPRAVFKVLWEYLKAGRPIPAYVNNRSADGSYYWVIAVVFAVPGGYLPVRLKPSGELFSSAGRSRPSVSSASGSRTPSSWRRWSRSSSAS